MLGIFQKIQHGALRQMYHRKPAKMQKRFLAGFLSVLLLVFCVMQNCSRLSVSAEETGTLADSELYALSAVLMDGENGRILYEKAGDEIRANASTTKIFTCILALENGMLSDTVTVSSYAAKMPDVQLNIVEGEEYRLEDLLYSLMLESHNDSAVAIAEYIGGSVEGFSKLMNQKAKAIGCMHSHFITPNGLDAEDDLGIHGTTASDLARILRYCIKESPEKETFLKITRTQSYSFSNLSGTRTFVCRNHNAFLNMMDGALTGKTGFTGNAGYCYVGALERDGHLYIVALLGCGWPGNKSYKWADTKKLMNYGIENYKETTVSDKMLQKMTVPILDDYAYSEAAESMELTSTFSYTLLLKEDERVSFEYHLPDALSVPVKAGLQAGSVFIYIDGTLFDIQPVYTTFEISKDTFQDNLEDVVREFFTHNF